MVTCYKCGREDIAKGTIYGGSDAAFSVFKPDDVRFFSLTYKGGTDLRKESYACLACGSVWSQTDPSALRKFIRKRCKRPSHEESTG
jgi:hypothetical protein